MCLEKHLWGIFYYGGNAYAQIIRDGRGKVTALYPLMPDKVLYEDTEENVTDGFIFDKVTVTNTLLRKIPKVKQSQPIVETGTPHEQLVKRLELLKC